MLEQIRQKKGGILAWVLIGLIILSFATFGISSFFDGPQNPNAATVNGEEISVRQLDDEFQRYLSNLRERMGDSYREELLNKPLLKEAQLNRMINDELIRQQSLDAGFAIPAESIVAELRAQPDFQVDGQFNAQRYKEVLAANGWTPERWEASRARQLRTQQLEVSVRATPIVTDAELDAQYQRDNETRDFLYSVLRPADRQASVTIDDETVQQYYESHQDAYMTPEQLKLEYVELEFAALVAKVEISAEELQKKYDDDIAAGRFTVPEQRRARHILLSSKDDDPEVLAKIEALEKQIAEGADFAELAKTNSEDPGSKAQGGDLNWVRRGMMVKPFEDALFAMSAGEVSKPIKSQFGYHLIKLDEIKTGEVQPLTAVEAGLRTQLQETIVAEKWAEHKRTMGDAAFSDDSLQPLAESLDVEVLQSDWLTANGGAGIGAFGEVMAVAFSESVLEKGEISSLITVGDDDRLVVVRRKEHKPSEARPLTEVKDEVVATLQREQAIKQVAAEGEQLLAQVNGGAEFRATLEAAKLSVNESDPVKRDTTAIDRELVQQAFKLAAPEGEVPRVAGIALDDGRYVLLSLHNVEEAVLADFDASDREYLRSSLQLRRSGTEYAAYLAALRAQADVDVLITNFGDE